MQYFEEEKVRRLLRIDDLIEAMRRVLAEFSAGKWKQPLRGVLAQHGGFFGVMPASGDSMGIKMVTFYPGNVALKKHTHMAIIQLFRSDTGEPLAVMDGRLITEMRTAAVSSPGRPADGRTVGSGQRSPAAGADAAARTVSRPADSGSTGRTPATTRTWPGSCGCRTSTCPLASP